MNARRRLSLIGVVAVAVTLVVVLWPTRPAAERLEDAFAPGPCDDAGDIIHLDSLVTWRGSWHVVPDGRLRLDVVDRIESTELRPPIDETGTILGVVAGDDTTGLPLAIPESVLEKLELLGDTGTRAIVRTASRADGSWASVGDVARVLSDGTVDWSGCGDRVFTTPLRRFQQSTFPSETGEAVLTMLLGNEELVARMTADPSWRQPLEP